MSDFVLFGVYPYIALALFLLVSIYRYLKNRFTYSSLSSEFLESRRLFWGSVPFHYGILFLFFGHLTAFVIPDAVLAWNGQPLRLMILEVTAFAFALLTLWGVILLIIRRFTNKRIRTVTTFFDVIVLFLLLFQMADGLWVAYYNHWGSSWFAAVITPYLYSIFQFNPNIDAISNVPFSIKLHLLSAMTFIAIFPFTRLVHFLVAPLMYIWRPYQVVIWNWNRKMIRNPKGYVKKVEAKNS